jgi:hypothetical protein
VRIYDRALSEAEVQGDGAAPLQTPQKAPVAAYSFDEGEGEAVQDLTGTGHTASIEGANWTDRGRYGGAMEFDREEEDFLRIAAAEDLDGSEELTVEAWVRPTANPFIASLVMKEREGSGADYSWTLDQQSSQVASGYFMQTEEGMVASGEGALPLATWTHVAVTDDGAHNRLYLNGELVDTAPAIEFDGHGEIRIGGNAAFASQWFDGRIDELRIYDRALSESEVRSDAAAPLQTPQRTPVAAYSFDEGEGSTVTDLSGGEHNGTVEGAEWARGRYGSSLKFDGEDMVTVPASEDLDLTEAFTLEVWIKPEAEGEYGHLFAKEDTAEEQTAYVITKHEDRLLAKLGFPGVEEQSPSETLEIGPWQHVAATYDGGRVRLYIDGELVGDAGVEDIRSTDGALRIGGADLWWSDEGFKGRIDEVRIYNRALTAGEIAADRLAPLRTPTTGPLAAYSFDEGEGETVEDLTGNGHTATIHDVEWTDRGRYGGALKYTATEESYVSIPASEKLDGNEEMTVEAWVRPTVTSPYYGQIAMKEREGNPAYTWSLVLHEDEPNGFFMRTEEGMVAGGEGSMPLHRWTHVAMTNDGARNRLYVNGELVDTEPGIPFDGHGEIRIGGNSIFGQYFDGRIDEVRIYDRALSEAEVQGDGAAPLQTPQKAPVAAYSFDEGEGEAVEDLTGAEHTATIEGAEWTRGKFGGALRFDGGDQLTIPASEDLNLTEAFTLEAWIKPEAEAEYGHLFAKEDASEVNAAYVITEHGSKLAAHLGVPGVQKESPSEALEVGPWQHIAATFDGGRVRLYVNSELVGTAPVAEILSTNGALRIGDSAIWGSGKGFDGRIDEVRIYDRALSADEAADINRPIFNQPFYVAAFPGEVGTTVIFPAAIDTSSFSGLPQSVAFYRYRFSVGEEPLSPWKTTYDSTFEIPTETSETAHLNVQVVAGDPAGNLSIIQSAETTIEAEGAPLNEEELNEAKEDMEEDGGPFFEEGFEESGGGEGESRRVEIPVGVCAWRADRPHKSKHAFIKNKNLINAEAEVLCSATGVTGYISIELMRVGPYGSYGVSHSLRIPVSNVKPLEETYARVQLEPCVPGTYFSLGKVKLVSPAGTRWRATKGPLLYRTFISKKPHRRVTCKEYE